MCKPSLVWLVGSTSPNSGSSASLNCSQPATSMPPTVPTSTSTLWCLARVLVSIHDFHAATGPIELGLDGRRPALPSTARHAVQTAANASSTSSAEPGRLHHDGLPSVVTITDLFGTRSPDEGRRQGITRAPKLGGHARSHDGKEVGPHRKWLALGHEQLRCNCPGSGETSRRAPGRSAPIPVIQDAIAFVLRNPAPMSLFDELNLTGGHATVQRPA
jgi:hypothetical protein